MTTPDASEEWLDDIFDVVVSDVQACGYFDIVNEHEPKSKPGHGLTAAVWVQDVRAIGSISGLASTSAAVIFTVRIYKSMLSEPSDLIDREMVRATSNLLRRYHDDFDFGGAIRNVDLLGAHTGRAIGAQAGYLDIDGKVFRIMDITVPCIVNDVWPQVS
jgi:hypothetical protein